MSIKKLLFLVFYCMSIVFSFGQQSVFTQYYFNPLYSNAGFAGKDYKWNISAQYKSMWTGMESSPATALITAHTPIGLSSSSIGIGVINDHFGITSNTGAMLYYAYRFQTKIGRISTGTQINFENYQQKYNSAIVTTANDPALLTDLNIFLFNIGLGIVWENEKGYFGLSSPAILKNSISEINDEPAAKTLVQFNLIGAYTIDVNDIWSITPSVLYKYAETEPSQLDMQIHVLYNKQIQLDAGFRSNSTYIAGISYFIFDELQIGYCYDYDNSSLGASAGGNHEILLGYILNKSKSE